MCRSDTLLFSLCDQVAFFVVAVAGGGAGKADAGFTVFTVVAVAGYLGKCVGFFNKVAVAIQFTGDGAAICVGGEDELVALVMLRTAKVVVDGQISFRSFIAFSA